MPKKAQLEPHLSSTELKERYQRSCERVETRRLHLLWLVCEGWQIKEAAIAIGLNYDYAREIVKAYNQQGIASLTNRRKHQKRRGRRPLLDAEQQLELQQALRQPPGDGGIWSGPKVAQWLADKTRLPSVHPQRGWDDLKRYGFSPSASASASHSS